MVMLVALSKSVVQLKEFLDSKPISIRVSPKIKDATERSYLANRNHTTTRRIKNPPVHNPMYVRLANNLPLRSLNCFPFAAYNISYNNWHPPPIKKRKITTDLDMPGHQPNIPRLAHLKYSLMHSQNIRLLDHARATPHQLPGKFGISVGELSEPGYPQHNLGSCVVMDIGDIRHGRGVVGQTLKVLEGFVPFFEGGLRLLFVPMVSSRVEGPPVDIPVEFAGELHALLSAGYICIYRLFDTVKFRLTASIKAGVSSTGCRGWEV